MRPIECYFSFYCVIALLSNSENKHIDSLLVRAYHSSPLEPIHLFHETCHKFAALKACDLIIRICTITLVSKKNLGVSNHGKWNFIRRHKYQIQLVVTKYGHVARINQFLTCLDISYWFILNNVRDVREWYLKSLNKGTLTKITFDTWPADSSAWNYFVKFK